MPAGVPIAATVAALREAVRQFRDAGESVGLVPTMGALHAGHLALVRHARAQAHRVVVSIFINPAQFGPTEDLSTYPRTFESDLAALAAERVDLVWVPQNVGEMYPPGFSTRIVPSGPAAVGLEDAFRPHFFSGVTTVVAKLLLQCLPDFATFGEKDFQQLRVVERMVADLNIPATIHPVPTVREADGLAMSSRNVYLSRDARARAPQLFAALSRAAQRIRGGTSAQDALAEERRALEAAGFALDYFEARHAHTLERLTGVEGEPIRLLAAARLGKTRLIDNVGV